MSDQEDIPELTVSAPRVPWGFLLAGFAALAFIWADRR